MDVYPVSQLSIGRTDASDAAQGNGMTGFAMGGQ